MKFKQITTWTMLSVFATACVTDDVTQRVHEDVPEADAEPEAPSLANCAVTIESDTNIDGFVNATELTHYDDVANPVYRAMDYQADGYVDQLHTWAYRQDDQIHGMEIRDEDGVIMRQQVYDYDEAGRLIRQETFVPSQEVSMNRYEYGYDERGFLNRQTLDGSANGVADVIWTWTNDVSGWVRSGTYQTVDTGNCGIRYTFENTWNMLGQLVEVETRYQNHDNDEVYAVRVVAYTYDEAGDLVFAEEHYQEELIRQEFWIRNEAGQVRVHQSDFRDEAWNLGVDGEMDAKETFSYDAGRLVRHDADTNGDGRLDWRITHRYDSEGRLIHTDQDSHANGMRIESEDEPDHFETSLDYIYVCD